MRKLFTELNKELQRQMIEVKLPITKEKLIEEDIKYFGQ